MNASQASLTKFFSPSISTDQAKNKEAGLKTGARFQPYPTKAPLKPSPSSTPPSYPTSFAKSASTSSTLSRNGSHTSSASVNGGHNGTVKTLMSGVTSTGFTRSISSSGGMSTGYNRAASMNTASSTAITTAPPRHFNPPLSAVSFESLQSNATSTFSESTTRKLPPTFNIPNLRLFDGKKTFTAPPPTFAKTSTSTTSNESGRLITWSKEQQEVLDLVLASGENIFYTGSAGTGKSSLMREIITQLRKKFANRESVAITAPTGIAAANINGCTLHSFAACGIANHPASQLAQTIMKSKKSVQRWRSTKVLIIDEISMVEGAFFDKLEQIARIVRGSERPFGGIQLIISGDFMQLPPVNKSSAINFAFDAKSWDKCIQKTVILSQVFRQKDSTFINILNEVRMGRISPASEKVLRSLCRPIKTESGIEPTELFAMRHQVDEANNRRLQSLPGPIIRFVAEDSGDPRHVDKFRESCLAPTVLELKENAQVMLIKNMDTTLVNGSLGRVVGFDERGWPLVDFGGGVVLIQKDVWSIDGPTGGTLAQRIQIPLVLAYAMSIHKSQGQTLKYLKVDLGKVFEKGQAYVALSRATDLDGLQVMNFRKEVVMAHPKVAEFHGKIGFTADARR